MGKISKDSLKGKALSTAGSVSGVTSFLGSYQVCHNLCVGLIALLSILGITVVGMPLLFLTKVAVYFWIAAVTLLVITILLKSTLMKGLSSKMLVFNFGLILIGVPFNSVNPFKPYFYLAGGIIALVAIGFFIRGRWRLQI